MTRSRKDSCIIALTVIGCIALGHAFGSANGHAMAYIFTGLFVFVSLYQKEFIEREAGYKEEIELRRLTKAREASRKHYYKLRARKAEKKASITKGA